MLKRKHRWSPRPVAKVAWILIVGLLVYSTGAGLWNGWIELLQTASFWPKFVAALNFSYGIAGLCALLMLALAKQRFIFWTMLAWAILCSSCAISAILVFSPPQERWTGAVPAALGLVAIFVPILIFVWKKTHQA